MSFLPYSNLSGSAFMSSFLASSVAHAGIIAVLVTTSVPFLPRSAEQEDPLSDVFVTLEIISVEPPQELLPDVIEDDPVSIDESEPVPIEDTGFEPISDDEVVEPDEEPLDAPSEPEDVSPENSEPLDPVNEPQVTEPETDLQAPLDPVTEPAQIAEQIVDTEETEPVDPVADAPSEDDSTTINVPDPENVTPPISDGDAVSPVVEDLAPAPEEPSTTENVPVPVPDVTEPVPELTAELPVQVPVDPVIAPAEDELFVDDVSLVEPTEDITNIFAEEGGAAPEPVEAADILVGTEVQSTEDETDLAGFAVPLEPDSESFGEGAALPPTGDGEQLAVLMPDQPDELIGNEVVVPSAIPQPDESELLPEAEETDVGDDLNANDVPQTEPDLSQQDESDEAGEAASADDGQGNAPRSAKGPVIAQPSAQTRALAQLIQGIRQTRAPRCAVALPRRASGSGVGVALIGDDDAGLERFGLDIAERADLDTDVIQVLERIDSRQCVALDAINQVEAYPATRIGIDVETTNLQSGDELRARIFGAEGLIVTLALIDDNGVVQNLERFTELRGSELFIEAPVARAGEGVRDTRQLLLVIGHRSEPIDLTEVFGETAQTVFTAIPANLLQEAQFGLVSFEVQ